MIVGAVVVAGLGERVRVLRGLGRGAGTGSEEKSSTWQTVCGSLRCFALELPVPLSVGVVEEAAA